MCVTAAAGAFGCLIVGGAPGGKRAGSAGAIRGFCWLCGRFSCGIRARGCGRITSGSARCGKGAVCIAVGGTRSIFGGWATGAGSLPGSAGCAFTPRLGIGSATSGGVTRVGDGAVRAGEGTIDGAGAGRSTDAGGGAEACGDGCTCLGRRTMTLSSAILRTGAMFLGGGATVCNSAMLVLTGNATFITGSRKRGPGTIVAPS